MPEVLRWILAALACYRLAELVALDEGPFRIFARFRAWAGCHPNDLIRENVAELVHCPYCLGVWFGALCAALAFWPTWPGDLFLAVLGLAGAQSILTGLAGSMRRENDAEG